MAAGLLDGKVIIVTGAAGGLGEGIAHVCHREGARIVLADLDTVGLERVAGSLGGEGSHVLAQFCDVSNDADLEALVERASDWGNGMIDGLVNNAGVNFAKPFLETTAEEWDSVISVDLRAVFFLSQSVAKRMVARPDGAGGSIVNVSSVHSIACLPGAGPYDAAKWGVVGLGKSIAVELATQNVRVNALSPGLCDTQIWADLLDAAEDRQACVDHWNRNIPIHRTVTPMEVGEAAAFLLSDRSRAITGTNTIIDGGMTAQLVSKEPFQSDHIGADR
jgi:NAD(P)-dependent dehydrogenase (short-subunit alcohol dehydrogenase family)